VLKGLTFDMSGTWRRAQPAVRCPLDGGVRAMWQRIAHIPDPTDATFNSYTMIDPAGLYIRSDRGGILFIYG
jgi:hypothetical protein